MMLKNARFTDLKELYLSNNNISELNPICMGDHHHFYQLIHLDLNNNNINNLIPIKVFKNLKMLNLQNNKISNEASTMMI